MVNNDSNFKSIELLRCWCMKSLPTVFSDALSYNQQVCLLTKAINDMANTINGLPDYIIELVKELLNQLNLETIVKEVLAELYFLNVKNPPNNMTAAVGDGVTDDTAAIQAMIAYLSGKRAYLFFPAGIYSVSGLNVTTNMSLVGLDRYQTTLQLRAGSNKDLLTGDLGACTINDITLDANMPGQTQNCSVFDGNVGNMLVSNVIFKNGYNVLGINVNGLVQIDNIMFDGVQGNGLSIGGDRVVINDIQFVNNSTLNAGTLITVSSTNSMITGLLNTGGCTTGLNVSGNNNVIIGVIRGATTPIVNTGTDNYIDIIGSVHTVIDGAYTHTINGNYNTSISGTLNQNITNDCLINCDTKIKLTSEDIDMNCVNPISYKQPSSYNEYFSSIPFKNNNSEYQVLVANNNTNKLNASTISVKDFGAKGDGITDDSLAFQNAIDSGLDVFIPFSGGEIYLINTTINVNKLNQIIYGDISRWGFNANTPYGYIKGTANPIFNVTSEGNEFYNLTFIDTNSSTSTTAIKIDGSSIEDSTDARVERCSFAGYNNALYYHGRNLKFFNNIIDQCNYGIEIHYTFNGTGGSASQQPNFGFRGCIIQNNKLHGVLNYFVNVMEGVLNGCNISGNCGDIGNGLIVSQAESSTIGLSLINNTIMYSNNYFALLYGDVNGLNISSNTFIGSNTGYVKLPIGFLYIGGTSKNVNINSNNISTIRTDIIVCKGSVESIVINGNNISDWGYDGTANRAVLKMPTSNGITLIGNSCFNVNTQRMALIRGMGDVPTYNNLKIIGNAYNTQDLISNYTPGINNDIQTANT